jgi:hypothetical protein
LRQNSWKYFQIKIDANIFKNIVISSNRNTHFAVPCFLALLARFTNIKQLKCFNIYLLANIRVEVCDTLECQALPPPLKPTLYLVFSNCACAQKRPAYARENS